MYQRPWPSRKATIKLPDQTASAAYGTWRRRVHAWERRERYLTGHDPAGTPYMQLGGHAAAQAMGVSTRTIERWRVIIWEGRHTHPGPWPGTYRSIEAGTATPAAATCARPAASSSPEDASRSRSAGP